MKQVDKMIWEVEPSDRYPKGGFKVVVNLWKSGKREKTLSIADYRSKKECKDAAEVLRLQFKNELKSEQKSAASGSSLTPRTFKDILEVYKSTPMRKGKNKGHLRTFEGEVARIAVLESELGPLRPEELEDKLHDFVAYCLEEKELSPATVNRHIAIAKCAVNTAHKRWIGEGSQRRRMLEFNYLEEFPMLEENSIRFRILTGEERDLLWSRLDPELQRLYYHALCVPIRMSELVNIRREHCNQISGCIILPETKAGPSRTIKIPEGLMDFVLHWPNGIDYLHHDSDGKPLGSWDEKRNRIEFNKHKKIQSALLGDPEKEGNVSITGYNFHKTRQEAVLRMYQEGDSIDKIKLVGGWHSDEAFFRYFSKELATQIDSKTFSIDTAWQTVFAEQIKKAA